MSFKSSLLNTTPASSSRQYTSTQLLLHKPAPLITLLLTPNLVPLVALPIRKLCHVRPVSNFNSFFMASNE